MTAVPPLSISRSAILLAMGIIVFALLVSVHNVTSGHERPNIIFIRTDDQDYRSMEARLPNGEYVMKNVKELIEQQGTKFTHFFVTFPLCCPSRATTLTGQYAHNHDVLSNSPPYGGYIMFNDDSTLPLWLQAAGYYTMHIGKYLNGYTIAVSSKGYPPPPPGWNKWYTLLAPADEYYNYKIYDGQQILTFGVGQGNYQTDVLTRKAREFLRKKPYGNRPFYLEVNYGAPHEEVDNIAVPAPRHVGMMDNAPLPMPPSFNEQDVSDKPIAIQNHPLLNSQDVDNITNNYRRRMESLLAVDEGVGKIIDMLQATGQGENTVIIFTSDNGYLHGEHRIKQGKFFPYEPLQVPFIMSGPGIPVKKTIHRLVTNVDYAPTIVEWADARPGLPQDGRSLVPLLAHPTTTQWRKDFMIENPIINHYQGMRTQNLQNGREYQYVEYDYNHDNVVDERELYALTPDECRPTGDPYQLESQHNNTCYTNLMQQFHQRLAFLKNCVGEACQ